MMRYSLIVPFIISIFSYSAQASKDVNCDIQLHTFNKLNTKKSRTFSGSVNYIYVGSKRDAAGLYKNLNKIKSDVCRPEISGNIHKLSGFLSQRLLTQTQYVGTIFFNTGQYNVNTRELGIIREKVTASNGLLFIGRASKPGERLANQRLSARRSLEVAKYFSGITSATVIALGDEQTAEELSNPQHDNRRVDVYRFQ